MGHLVLVAVLERLEDDHGQVARLGLVVELLLQDAVEQLPAVHAL